MLRTVLEGIHNYEGIFQKRVEEETEMIDKVLLQVRKEGEFMEAVNTQFQNERHEGEMELDSALDEIIAALKTSLSSYQNIGDRVREIKTKAEKVEIASDSKQSYQDSNAMLKNMESILQKLEEMNPVLLEHQTTKIDNLNEKEVGKSFGVAENRKRKENSKKNFDGVKTVLVGFISAIGAGLLVGFLVVFLRIQKAMEQKRII